MVFPGKMKSKIILRRLLALALVFSLILGLPFTASAAESSEEGELTGGQSNIINGSFEEPDKKSEDTNDLSYKYTAQSEIPGWATTSTNGTIELGWMKQDGITSAHMIPTIETVVTSGVGASDGWQFAETIGNEVSSLYQILTVKENAGYHWTVHHRGRNGVDTLALFIVDAAQVNYVKSSKTASDHFAKIVAWMKEQGISPPAEGTMVPYTVYTTALLDNGGFAPCDAGFFSAAPDAEHTVKFQVYLMSSGKADWGEYTDAYQSDADKQILFAVTSFKSASSSATSGNLVDHLSFRDIRGNNLLMNPGFEDAVVSNKYYMANAANAASPFANIGWCTTASDYKVEIGNLKKGNAYGLDISIETIEKNKPSIRDGQQFAELNADQASSLYQIVATDEGKMYRWSLSHRGRSGMDTMALVIGPSQDYAPKKANATTKDQLMQIVDWLYTQKDVVLDIPEQGCSSEIKLYTPKFNANGGFTQSSDLFRWYQDDTHTEEWSVWIISSPNDAWHDYGSIDSSAAYNYDYIVPNGQENTIFGFVSVKSAPRDTGTIDKTYGNLLDNIAFREYYYINAKFTGSDNVGGYAFIDPENEEDFIFDGEGDARDTGWALAGSTISVHFNVGEREFIGAYVNGEFIPKENWTYDEEKKEYSYQFVVNSSITIDPVYQAQQVIYDTRNGYPYQYDLEDDSTGCEVPMGNANPVYTSHAPQADDGWQFVSWRYSELLSSESGESILHRFDAVHIVKYDADNTLSIWRVGDETAAVSGIPYDKGILFLAEWTYRQRVIAQTFDIENAEFYYSTAGGSVDVSVPIIESGWEKPVATDYESFGRELYAPSGDTYVNVIAQNNPGYAFSGWYDSAGKLIDRNPSYTYKVTDGSVKTLYARFEPIGYSISINACVVDSSESSETYFGVVCSFSNLRAGHLYAIYDLVTDPITVNGKEVMNPTVLRADESGNATVTIYVKDGDVGYFAHLPENCVYTVVAEEESKAGYNVRGEVHGGSLSANTEITLRWSESLQVSRIAVGKHYMDISSQSAVQTITITKNSSYTFCVDTQYIPSLTVYPQLSTSLCFEGGFAPGTRILMIDKTDGAAPRFYVYMADSSVSEIPLTAFTALGATDPNDGFSQRTGEELITERLLFVVDYGAAGDLAQSGSVSLVYRDSYGDISKAEKTVNIGDDGTQLTAAAANGAVTITVTESTPAINTTYQGTGDNPYRVKLSLNNGSLLPEGSYAELDGVKYESHKGYILISPLSAGTIPLKLHIQGASPGDVAAFKAELFSAVSTSPGIPAVKTATFDFTCVDDTEYAINGQVSQRVLKPGVVSQWNATVAYVGIDEVRLTLTQKGEQTPIKDITLSTDGSPLTLDFGGFTAQAGETYILLCTGYASGVPVCADTCCIVCGYIG